MKTAQVIYENGDHRWLAIVRDPDRPGYLIDTNEYLVSVGEDAILLDPGGSEIFPSVFSALCAEYDPRRISKIFASHQDPDIISSLSMWMEFNPDIKCHISWLWAGFVPHFGGTGDTFIPIPDPGWRSQYAEEIIGIMIFAFRRGAARCIKIAQRGITKSLRAMCPVKKPLDKKLGFAIRAPGDNLFFLGDRNGLGLVEEIRR